MSTTVTSMSAVEARLVALFDASGVALAAVLVAVAVGAFHALAPGHGKAIAAAYLVGARARPRDAVTLGVIVAAMHTVSVVVLGSAWVALSATTLVATETLTTWLQLVTAVVVVAVGVNLLRARRGHHHVHGSVDAPPWSRRGLVALAVGGGLLPSPSAFLVLVSGLLSGRVAFAAVLVVAFGAGMAATLAAVGLTTLRGRLLVDAAGARWPRLERAATRVPVLAACGVLLGGVVYLAAAARALTAG